MRYWRIQFLDRELAGQDGWLQFDDINNSNSLFQDDGTPVTEGVSYTTTDTDPTPPSWG